MVPHVSAPCTCATYQVLVVYSSYRYIVYVPAEILNFASVDTNILHVVHITVYAS